MESRFSKNGLNTTQCFENHSKSLIWQYCEQSELVGVPILLVLLLFHPSLLGQIRGQIMYFYPFLLGQSYPFYWVWLRGKLHILPLFVGTPLTIVTINVARFARIVVKWDFLRDFQTLWCPNAATWREHQFSWVDILEMSFAYWYLIYTFKM